MINLEQNQGLVKALNLGIEKAISLKVDYIARMDSDDISLPNRLEIQANFLELNSNVDIVGSSV